MGILDNIIKAVKPIDKKKFSKHANHKTVKTRTPHLAVEQYEKKFKKKYGDMIGKMSNDVMEKMTKQMFEK